MENTLKFPQNSRRYTPEMAFMKIKHYCAYQERSHFEVKEKLYGFGLSTAMVEHIISQLIEEDYLNEERFAIAFVRGKFKMKHWGRIKITYELKLKKVSAYCIKKALNSIDEDEYAAQLLQLMQKKYPTLKGKAIEKQAKLYAYFLAKGYESGIISNVMKQLFAHEKKH